MIFILAQHPLSWSARTLQRGQQNVSASKRLRASHMFTRTSFWTANLARSHGDTRSLAAIVRSAGAERTGRRTDLLQPASQPRLAKWWQNHPQHHHYPAGLA